MKSCMVFKYGNTDMHKWLSNQYGDQSHSHDGYNIVYPAVPPSQLRDDNYISLNRIDSVDRVIREVGYYMCNPGNWVISGSVELWQLLFNTPEMVIWREKNKPSDDDWLKTISLFKNRYSDVFDFSNTPDDIGYQEARYLVLQVFSELPKPIDEEHIEDDSGDII